MTPSTQMQDIIIKAYRRREELSRSGHARRVFERDRFATTDTQLYGRAGIISMREGSENRLESIREAHESEKSASSSRTEDYLEVIAELVDLKGYAATLDISRYMDVSASSVTQMLQRLDEGGYLNYEKYRGVNLTRKGDQIAQAVRQKHGILLEFLGMLGVGREAANRDAEGIEHHLNPKTIRQLRKFVAYLRANPAVLAGFREP